MGNQILGTPCPVACCECEPERVYLLSSQEEELLKTALSEISPTLKVEDTIVQFATGGFFCQEDEGEAIIDVVRFGNLETMTIVDYATEDASAISGVRYWGRSGTLIFRPGETTLSFSVPVIGDDKYDSTLEFRIRLSNPRGGIIGKNLMLCQVKVLDDDSFPTNYFKKGAMASKEKVAELPKARLFFEYLRMNLQDKDIRRHTFWSIACDQTKNLYYFFTLYLQVYLIDVVLGPELEVEEKAEAVDEGGEPEEGAGQQGLLPEWGLLIPNHRGRTAAVVGILYILPFAALQIIDLRKVSWLLAGHSRRALQANLLRKYLHYTEDARSQMSQADVTMCMVRDVREVVDCGFIKLLEVFAICGKLLLALVFILAENEIVVIPLVICPIVMMTFLIRREELTTRVNEATAAAQNGYIEYLNGISSNFRLVADYFQKSRVADTFITQIENCHDVEGNALAVGVVNQYLSPWLTTVLVGLYIIFGIRTTKTFGGKVTVGVFLATINVCKEVGVELKEIYTAMLEIQRCFGPLGKIAYYLNLPIDLGTRMNQIRSRVRWGLTCLDAAEKEKRLALMNQHAVISNGSGCNFVVDEIKLRIENLTLIYPERKTPLLQDVTLEFNQGGFYAFVGGHNHGRSTLLRLLAGVEFPTSGDIYIPPHLRTLHIPEDHFLVDGSFYTNITFGCFNHDVGRIERICRRCGVPEHLIARLKFGSNDSPTTEWIRTLSKSDRARISLARSFISDAEIMIVHKPTLYFSGEEAVHFYQIFRSFVDSNGLELPEAEKLRRRTRTVFLSAMSIHDPCAMSADAVYEVKNGSVTQIRKPLENMPK